MISSNIPILLGICPYYQSSLVTDLSLPEGILHYEWIHIYTPDITAHTDSKLYQRVHYKNGSHLNKDGLEGWLGLTIGTNQEAT